MIATVTRLYKNGVPIPSRKKHDGRLKELPSVHGDLHLNCGRHPILGREVTSIGVIGDGERLEMIDAVCISISANGMHFRGIELSEGRHLAQEWWVRM